jgi:hypothetical protein
MAAHSENGHMAMCGSVVGYAAGAKIVHTSRRSYLLNRIFDITSLHGSRLRCRVQRLLRLWLGCESAASLRKVN